MKRIAVAALLAVLFVAHVACPACAQSAVERTPTGFYWPTGTSDLGNYAGWLSNGCSWSEDHTYSTNQVHIAVDIAADVGDPVYAIAQGKVLRLSPGGWGAGNIGVLVEHQLADGTSYIAIYGHVRSQVVVGDEVAGGEPFATIGPYSPPHLHFAIRPGTSIDSPYGAMPCPASPPIIDTNGFVDPVLWITTRAPAGSNEPGEPGPVEPGEGGPEPEPVEPGEGGAEPEPVEPGEGGAEPDPADPGEDRLEWPPSLESHPEREARLVHWLQQQCASVGVALMLPMLAYAAFGRRRIGG